MTNIPPLAWGHRRSRNFHSDPSTVPLFIVKAAPAHRSLGRPPRPINQRPRRNAGTYSNDEARLPIGLRTRPNDTGRCWIDDLNRRAALILAKRFPLPSSWPISPTVAKPKTSAHPGWLASLTLCSFGECPVRSPSPFFSSPLKFPDGRTDSQKSSSNPRGSTVN